MELIIFIITIIKNFHIPYFSEQRRLIVHYNKLLLIICIT